MNHIMCPYDGSDPASRALELAIVLATALGARLTILVVTEFIVGRHDVAEVWTEQEMNVILDHAKGIIAKNRYPNATIVEERSRDASVTIVGYAEQNEVDLIVLGASGKNTAKRFLLGSVSNDVVRKAHCPVTIVH